MEQQLDAFTQRRFELMLEIATKKLQSEIGSIKECLCSLSGDINSVKNQISRLQFQPHQNTDNQTQQNSQAKKEDVKIVDCRPENERKTDFQSGSAKNSEPLRPRYGDYQPEDVSIDKFFYFGRK